MSSPARKNSLLRSIPRFLSRGESGIAPVGIASIATLVLTIGLAGWWSLRQQNETVSRACRRRLEAAGPLIAQEAGQELRDNETTAVRQMVVDQASKFDLRVCRLTVGDGQIIADATPSQINTPVVPDRWATISTAPVSAGPGEFHLQYPVAVTGRGTAVLDIVASNSGGASADLESWSGTGLAGILGLAALLIIYRRNRSKMVELDLIRNALSAISAGETNAAALKIDSTVGPAATAWNHLLEETDGLRRRAIGQTAAASGGGRRGAGGTLERACDAMSQGLVLVDDQMKVRFANGAACAFLHWQRDGLTGKPALELIEDEKFREAIQAIAEGKLRRPVTVELETTGDGGLGVLRFCIRPVRRGDADSAMIIVEDITQQRTAERARNAFVNQVTHELRTPLTNIRLYTETAIETGETDTAVRSNCLNVINLECRRLERIVGEMLSVAEIDAGSATVRREDVYFETLIEELNNDYEAQAADKQIKLQFVLSPKLPKIQADRDKLVIALHNLIANSLKYTPAGGSVTVTADVKDGQLVVDVTDTGIGIKPEEQERIFDRFYRSTDPRVGKIVGTGLGLTLAREVIRLHGGEVTLRSEIDKGSTFTATLPLSAAA